ncbi:Peptidase family S49 [uncultured archaeon]|nr:Peptidase family S49 [uncultured archaeon]
MKTPAEKKNGLPLAWMGAGLLGILLLAGLLYVFFSSASSLPSLGRGCIGVIDIKGEITADDTPDTLFSQGQAGSSTIAKLIQRADERPDVRGILVVIDSPGGSSLGSREIYSALRASDKPKVSYLRELAASGGYYSAIGTDYIVSEPDTLTGSIGVRMTITDLSGLFSKLGYNETTIKSGELKDIGTPDRPMTDAERQIFEGIVNETFGEFKDAVVARRGSKLAHPGFEQALDGRVLTGRQAQAIGLVDEIGTQKMAEQRLASMLNESKPLPLCPISSSRPGLFSSLFSGLLATPPLEQAGGWHLSYQ